MDVMENHLRIIIPEHHIGKLFECEVCSIKMSSCSQLKIHIDNHLRASSKPYSCTLCDQSYSLPRQLKSHLKAHTSGLPCFHCSKIFSDARMVVNHFNWHSTNYRPYECETCHKKFITKGTLKAHKKIHVQRIKNYKCRTCFKVFYTRNHLQDHTAKHNMEKNHACDVCSKKFPTPRSLDLHSITHFKTKSYACRACPKTFLRKGEVEDHERTHTGEKPFQCEVCGATFSQRSNLASHKKAIHLMERNFHCDLCQKTFKRRRLLNYHTQSVHTGERPFQCEQCPATFVYPEHHKNHMKTHKGIKPYVCDICNKSFTSKDNRNAHKFIHSEKKLYECILCGISFMRKPHLIRHIKQHPVVNHEDFIKVNPASVVNDEVFANRITIADKPETDETSNNVTTTYQIVKDADSVFATPLQIVDSDSDMPRYILHTNHPKSDDEEVNQFLATLDGQVMEMRTEDLETYSEMSTEKAQANSAAEVGQLTSVEGEYATFELQLDDSSPLNMTVPPSQANIEIKDTDQHEVTIFAPAVPSPPTKKINIVKRIKHWHTSYGES